MRYNYQDILKLQSVAEVDFETADKALKRAKGDFNKAEYFARKRKTKAESRSETTQVISDIFTRFFRYRFIAYRGEITYINIRMWIIILLVFFFNCIFVSVLGILLLPIIITLFIGVEYKVVDNLKKKEEPTINTEPVAKDTYEDGSLDINLSEEVVEDDEEGFVKVEIDK